VHPLFGSSESARIDKDAAAGAVLMLSFGSAAEGVCILGPNVELQRE